MRDGCAGQGQGPAQVKRPFVFQTLSFKENATRRILFFELKTIAVAVAVAVEVEVAVRVTAAAVIGIAAVTGGPAMAQVAPTASEAAALHRFAGGGAAGRCCKH